MWVSWLPKKIHCDRQGRSRDERWLSISRVSERGGWFAREEPGSSWMYREVHGS